MAHFKKAAALAMTSVMMISALPTTALAAHKSEWVEKDGKWYHYDYEGRKEKYTTAYDSSTGEYYLLGSKGARVTGKKGLYSQSYRISNYGDKVKFKTSYYLKTDGSVLRYSWKKISGKYYYFDYQGRMVKGASVSEYDSEKDKIVYYLLGTDGKRVTKKGWHQVTNKEFNEYTGYVTTSKVWYYVKSDGTLQTGLKKISGKYYGFKEDGSLAQNGYFTTSSGKKYLADKNGVRIKKTGWITVSRKYSYKYPSYSYSGTRKYKCYLKKDYTVTEGWKKLSGKWYYFGYDGTMYANSSMSIWDSETGKSTTYIFNKKGVCINH